MRHVNSDIAYEYLKKRILSGEYAPGQSLMTYLLADEIGVSRTPIRDALRQLEADGLVTIKPRLGASVKEMDVTTFRENCELRLALESFAAGLAARNRTILDLQEMQLAIEEMSRITARMKSPGSARLLPALAREDVRFHLAVIAAAKNEVLKKEILRLHLVSRVVVRSSTPEREEERPSKLGDPAHRDDVVRSHEKILQAISVQDANAAKQEMEAHLQQLIDRSVHQHARAAVEASTRTVSEEAAIYQL